MKNQIPEKVIVCLTDEEKKFSCDAELPTSMRVKDLRLGLFRLLSECEPNYYARCKGLRLSLNGEPLPDNQTLASVGAWDGTRLSIHAIQALHDY